MKDEMEKMVEVNQFKQELEKMTLVELAELRETLIRDLNGKTIDDLDKELSELRKEVEARQDQEQSNGGE